VISAGKVESTIPLKGEGVLIKFSIVPISIETLSIECT